MEKQGFLSPLHGKLILLLYSTELGSSLKGALHVSTQDWEVPFPFPRRRSSNANQCEETHFLLNHFY